MLPLLVIMETDSFVSQDLIQSTRLHRDKVLLIKQYKNRGKLEGEIRKKIITEKSS